MSTAEIVLEYFKLLLSTPVVAGLIACGFTLTFKAQLGRLIDRVASIKVPGGELSTPQLPPDMTREAPKDLRVLDEAEPVLPPQPQPADIQRFTELLRAERTRAYLWEYRYLNLFLVPRTIVVLEWFAGIADRPTDLTYDTFWSTRIPDVSQRRVILSVLESHHLVQRDGSLLGISEKGREYLEWKDKV